MWLEGAHTCLGELGLEECVVAWNCGGQVGSSDARITKAWTHKKLVGRESRLTQRHLHEATITQQASHVHVLGLLQGMRLDHHHGKWRGLSLAEDGVQHDFLRTLYVQSQVGCPVGETSVGHERTERFAWHYSCVNLVEIDAAMDIREGLLLKLYHARRGILGQRHVDGACRLAYCRIDACACGSAAVGALKRGEMYGILRGAAWAHVQGL